MAAEPLAALEDLARRIDWEMDEDETRVATSALEDLSHEARFLGSNSWETANVTPPYVRTLILKAASRYLKNVEGYIASRAGDEQVSWPEAADVMGTASFTDREEKRLSQLARPSALLVTETYAYSNGKVSYDDNRYRVPQYGGGMWYPFLTPRDLE